MPWKPTVVASVLASLTCGAAAQDPQPHATPPTVLAWCEDLADAHAQSTKDAKPVLAYFTFDT